MNNSKKSFIIYKDSLSILNKLSREQAGDLFKAIAHYQIYGYLPEIDTLTDMIITPFITQFMRDEDSYKSVCERNRINGSKAKKSIHEKNNDNDPDGTSRTQSHPVAPDNDKIMIMKRKDNDNKKENTIIEYFNLKTGLNKYQKGSDRQKVLKDLSLIIKSGDTEEDIKILIDYKLANPNTQKKELLAWISPTYVGKNMSDAKEWYLNNRPTIQSYQDIRENKPFTGITPEGNVFVDGMSAGNINDPDRYIQEEEPDMIAT